MAVEMEGEETIKAPVETVWKALNDPEILRACIPGCQELTKKSDTELEAKVQLKIGPIKATFDGAVELKNINAPMSYTIEGEGKGGVAGFAKGGADVHLTAIDEGTLLKWEAKADIGGKMAQMGSRLVKSTSKKLAGEFFSCLNTKISDGYEGNPSTPTS